MVYLRLNESLYSSYGSQVYPRTGGLCGESERYVEWDFSRYNGSLYEKDWIFATLLERNDDVCFRFSYSYVRYLYVALCAAVRFERKM